MKVYEHEKYRNDLEYIAGLNLPWNLLKNNGILISGASGLIGSCLIDTIMLKNAGGWLNCTVYALSRNVVKARERFSYCWDNANFNFIEHDINLPLENYIGHIEYVLHMASNTHPVAYATDPIGTITTNIIGTNNMLKFAGNCGAKRFAFTSSNEIYGKNRGDTEFFDEYYCGYIDSNTMRAGYPESKRCGEALCQAYRKQENIDIVIPRLTRSYGPTMLMSDTGVTSQFIKDSLAGEDIVLKSAGSQLYSFTYVADAVAGLLTVLLCGINGEAYNIADQSGDIILKDLANIIAEYTGTKVVFEQPDEIEKVGYSVVTKARLDGRKLKQLGWIPRYDIKTGIQHTIDILRDVI